MNPALFESVYSPATQAAIRQLVDTHPELVAPDALNLTNDFAERVSFIFSGWDMPLADHAMLDRFPNLRVIFYAAGTVKPFVTDELWRRDIAVTTATSANAIAVAEYSHSVILFSLKRGWFYARKNPSHWLRETSLQIPGTYGSTVGIISASACGSQVCERLKQHSVNVLCYDPYLTPKRARQLGVTSASLEQVFEKSDVVSIHAPSLAATHHLVSEALISSMKESATLINTARGDIIDEKGLIRVFQERPDLYAVLDVTDPEPPTADSPLFELDNVILTPHLAGAVGLNERNRLGDLMLQELRNYLAGKPLAHAVNPSKLSISA